MKERLHKHWPVLALLGVFAVTRWPGLMKLPNFSMAYGLVFCAGAFPRRLPWWAVLGTMLATDIGLAVFYYHANTVFSDYQAVNYLAYAALFGLGRFFNARSALWKLIGGGLLGAVFFYLITNTASWLHNPEYQKTFAGWVRALTTGVSGWPETWTFFRNTLLGGGLFTGIIAGVLQATEAEEPEPEEAEEPAKETDPAADEQKA